MIYDRCKTADAAGCNAVWCSKDDDAGGIADGAEYVEENIQQKIAGNF